MSLLPRPPDFLCIGAQKAGTTWLATNLRRHPQLWIPPVKALNYFNDPARLPNIFRLLRRPDGTKAHHVLARFRRSPGKVLTGAMGLWYARFLLCPRTDRWYASLFAPAGAQVCGEATPAYAQLEEADVARVRRLAPQARILYLLRNPVERAWSQAAMHFEKRGAADLSAVSTAELRAFFEKPSVRRHGEYMQTLARWERWFPAAQLWIGFFDRLQDHPAAFFAEVCRFLGVKDDPASLPPDLETPRNRRPRAPLPPEIRADLVRLHGAEIAALHQRFQNADTARWLESLGG